MQGKTVLTWTAVLVMVLMPVTGQAGVVNYYMFADGATTVSSGHPVVVNIYASFDVRLTAAQYSLSASGDAQVDLTARLANPDSPCGLTYISQTSQVPFENNLPVNLNTTVTKEIFFDMDFDLVPGGSTDGIPPTPPGEWVLIDQITLVPTGAGQVTISMSYPAAATTENNANGEMVENVAAAIPSITLTVESGLGDYDGNGVIDLDDFAEFANCLAGPDSDPGTTCTDVFDMDSDGDVDLADFAIFQEIFNG